MRQTPRTGPAATVINTPESIKKQAGIPRLRHFFPNFSVASGKDGRPTGPRPVQDIAVRRCVCCRRSAVSIPEECDAVPLEKSLPYAILTEYVQYSRKNQNIHARI